MGEDWSDEAVRVSDLFTQIMFKTLSQRLIAELSDAKVSLPQIQAMRYIWLHEKVLIGDLAEGLMISYPSATNMVNRLEKQGLVERVVNPSDRREVEVRLTEHGAHLTERMEDERVSRLRSVLSHMQDADRESLIRGLFGFICAAVDENEPIAKDICLRCGARASTSCPVAQKQILGECQ